MSRKKPLVGVTGMIGSGKSTFSRMLGELGAAVFDADAAARKAAQDPQVLAEIRRVFGPDVLTAAGRLDRGAMADRVFSRPGELQKLNRIIHPWVRGRMWRFVAEAEKDPSVPMIVVDAPLIFETDLHQHLDVVVVVAADEETCIQRTMKRSRLPRRKIIERMRSQMPLEEKMHRADFVVDNGGDLQHLKKQAKEVFERILRDFRKK